MRVTLTGLCQKRAPSRRYGARRAAEIFESRCVLSAVWPAVSEPLPNDTLDLADDLGALINDLQTSRAGSIGDSPALGADVDWYRFTLDDASRVALTCVAASPDTAFQTCLSLYNSSPFTGEDFYNPLGHRLLAQAVGSASGSAQIGSPLAAGTYYVAVSSAGNEAFHPFVANSGYPGATGDYVLQLTSASLDVGQEDGPTVLTSEPVAATSLPSSPFVIRVDLNAELDPGTIVPDETVQVIYSPNDAFDDGDEISVPLSMLSFSWDAAELQLTPSAPLAIGYYQVTLAGDLDQHSMVLTGLNGMPLGSCTASPQGCDFSFQFQVAGIEESVGEDATCDDTPETAHQLGTLADGHVVQASGAIGDDPYYDLNVASALNPAGDVDLYHFQIDGEGTYAFLAEVWAGRIGSPLDPGVSLFRVDPNDGSLKFVVGNNNTRNDSKATNGTLPLYTDATLFTGLSAGDYYIAVSSGRNTPSPSEGQPLGGEGIFDPTQSHSGWAGTSTGNYLLNLQITADLTAPSVASSSLNDGDNLSEPPTHLAVSFSETVNLRQLAFEAFHDNTRGDIPAVFIQATDGTKYFPRFDSYNLTTDEATFLMLDALPSGAYQLHLSASHGLADFAGNSLIGNDPSGDYVVAFQVSAAPRGTNGNPTQWTATQPNDDATSPQDLGVLFPQEFANGIKVTRAANPDASDTADYFQFETLRTQKFQFNLSGTGLPAHIAISVLDSEGDAIRTSSSRTGAKTVLLHPGVYFVRVDGWDISDAAALQYQLSMKVLAVPDNPPALTVGPASSLQLRLVGTTSLPSSPPQVSLQDNGSNVVSFGGNGSVGSQTGSSGAVESQVSGTSPSSSNVSGTTSPTSLPSLPDLRGNGQTTASTAGSGSGQTSSAGSVTLPLPATSLVALGERLLSGVGATTNVIPSSNGNRIVLQLPEWFEWAGSHDLATINISSNVRERLLRNDAEDDFDGTVPSPTEAAQKTTSQSNQPIQTENEENSENGPANTPSESNSRESADRKDASANEVDSGDEGTKSTAKQRAKGDSVSIADFEWLPALAAVISGGFADRREEDTRRKLFARHTTRDGRTESNTRHA